VKPPRRSTRLGLLRRPIGCSRRWRHRSTWQIWHVRAEAQRQIRAANITANRAEQLVDLLVAEVLNTKPIPLMPPDNAIVEPVPLRRADGSSVYAVAGADLFTSARILRQVQWNLVSSPPQQVLGRVPLTLRQQVADLRAVITDLLPIAVLSELSRRHPSHDAVRTLEVLDQLENGGIPYENELQSLSYLASLTLDLLTWHSARKDVRAEISDDAWRQILSRVKDKDQFADTLAELYIWGLSQGDSMTRTYTRRGAGWTSNFNMTRQLWVRKLCD
jgi:hypothetical protein